MIKIVCVGKVKDKNLLSLIDDYKAKINHYHKLEIVEVKDEKITDNEKAVLDIEAQRVLDRISNDEYVILIDLHGKAIDSIPFSIGIFHIKGNWHGYLIPLGQLAGGSLGLGNKLIDRANEKIKLSDLTFLHQMCRLILLEQIYRCFKINNNETYHK